MENDSDQHGGPVEAAGVASGATAHNLAQEMISKRVRPSTAKGYANSMKIMGRWLVAHGGSVDGDGFPTLSLDHGLSLNFFGALVEPRGHAPHPIFGAPRKKILENGGHLSAATVGGFKSSISWLYTEKRQTIAADLDKELNLFMSGYKKTVADMKQSGEMSAFEGKQALSFAGYKLLATTFMQLTPRSSSTGNHRGSDGTAVTWSMGSFAWSFLLLQWNLIARSISVSSIMLAHLAWKDDHMTCTSPRSKTDQTGESAFPKSIFANTIDPVLCPILAVAVLILSRPHRSSGISPALFEGPDQEDRYGKILTAVLSGLPESTSSALGAKKSDIGTHSARKGAPTYVLSMPGGPSPVSTFLRAGWSLGNVKDRYIFEGEGGDQVSATYILN